MVVVQGATLGGSVAVNTFKNTVTASIGNSANVFAGGTVAVKASDDSSGLIIAGALGIGISGGGVGVSVSVTNFTKNTRAYIGTSAIVTGLGWGSGTSVNTDISGSSFSSATAKGVVVQATSSEDIKGYVVAGGAGLYVGVGGAVSVGIFDSGTRAYIDSGAQINTQAGTAFAELQRHGHCRYSRPLLPRLCSRLDP